MKKYFKIGFYILLAVFVVMQLFRPTKNIHKGTQPNSITSILSIRDSINGILKKACYDCHSNNTSYPWYAEVAPVSWLLNNHVVDGKKHLNFDEFATYKPKKALHKLEEVAEQIEKGKMPMDSYTWIHKDAKLTSIEKKALIDWANNAKASLQSKYSDTLKVN